jgi:hypothetical protein
MELEIKMELEMEMDWKLELEVELKGPDLHNQSLVYNLLHHKFLACNHIFLYPMEVDSRATLGIEP